MNKFLFYTLLVCSFIAQNEQISEAGKPRRNDRMSFIILGDIHYCDENHYDLDAMQRDKPSDYRQITGTYAPVTKSNWADMTSVIRQSIRSTDPPIKCIIQLGDISEGLANIPGQADIIAEDVTSMLEAQDFKVPFIYAKGNHDITGIGELRAEARQAFSKHHVPYLKKQTGNNGITEGNYTYTEGDVLFVMLDAYNPSIDQTEFLKQSLESSSAKYKFVCMHEPAIPASERCWHYLKSGSAAERDRFLRIIAENKAFFLCGHLHRYSVLRRNTEWGPIVQVMATSVTSVKRRNKPSYELKTEDYGPALVDRVPSWNPETAEIRKEILREEAKYVDYYQMNNLAGYGVISVDPKKDRVVLRYYPAFEAEAYDEIDLTALYNRK